MPEPKHQHQWGEDLRCSCGAILEPPETAALTANTIAVKNPAIQIIVELKKETDKAFDKAIEAMIKQGEARK